MPYLRALFFLLMLAVLLTGCDTVEDLRTDPTVAEIEEAEFYNALQDTIVDAQIPVLVLGLINLLVGWRLRRMGLVLNGFVIGGLVVYTLLLNADLGIDQQILVGLGLAAGLAIGVAAFFVYNLIALVIGGVIGTTLMGGAWLQVADNVPPQLLVFVTTFISAMLMFLVFRLFLVAFTAVIGAGLLMLGMPFEPVWVLPVAVFGVLMQTGIAWSIKDDIFQNLRGDLGTAIAESFAEVFGLAWLLRERQRDEGAPVSRSAAPVQREKPAREPAPKPAPPRPAQQSAPPPQRSAPPQGSYSPPPQHPAPPQGSYNPPPQQPAPSQGSYSPPPQQPAPPQGSYNPPPQQPSPPQGSYNAPPPYSAPAEQDPVQPEVPPPPLPGSVDQTVQNVRYQPANLMLKLSDGRQFPLAGTQMVVGRHPENEIVVNDPQVSGRHLVISVQPEGVVVWDDNSTNGTFLNGAPLQGSVRLGMADVLQIGDMTLRLVHPADDETVIS